MANDRQRVAKDLYEAGHGRNEIARVTGIPSSTITRWMKEWERQGGRKRHLTPILDEEQRLRALAMGEQYEIPEYVAIYSEEERAQFLFLLEQAKGDYTRIARTCKGGPFKLLPPPPPPMSRADQYRRIYGSESKERRQRRARRKEIKRMADYYGHSHPPGYGGE